MISNLSLRFWFVVVLFVSIQLSPALSEDQAEAAWVAAP